MEVQEKVSLWTCLSVPRVDRLGALVPVFTRLHRTPAATTHTHLTTVNCVNRVNWPMRLFNRTLILIILPPSNNCWLGLTNQRKNDSSNFHPRWQAVDCNNEGGDWSVCVCGEGGREEGGVASLFKTERSRVMIDSTALLFRLQKILLGHWMLLFTFAREPTTKNYDHLVWASLWMFVPLNVALQVCMWEI